MCSSLTRGSDIKTERIRAESRHFHKAPGESVHFPPTRRRRGHGQANASCPRHPHPLATSQGRAPALIPQSSVGLTSKRAAFPDDARSANRRSQGATARSAAQRRLLDAKPIEA